MKIQSIQTFYGIEASGGPAMDALMKSVEAAATLAAPFLEQFTKLPGAKVALSASLHSVNALLAASSTKCTLAAPPADIEIMPDSNHKLIYRCEHKQPHSWDLAGNPIP